MKINFMMFIIALTFFTVLGILGASYYENVIAMQNGLQQCIVNISDTKYEVVWTKECK